MTHALRLADTFWHVSAQDSLRGSENKQMSNGVCMGTGHCEVGARARARHRHLMVEMMVLDCHGGWFPASRFSRAFNVPS